MGRLQDLQPTSSGWIVAVLREGKLLRQVFPKLFIEDLGALQDSEIDLTKILRVGDLVAVAKTGGLTLLAPQTSPLPKRRFNLESLRLWLDFIYWVREYFREKGFVEIQTPGLVPCPGTEPSLDVFKTELVLGSHRKTLYLPTSPELHLKKALALGAEKIFEIKKCYRNGEVTSHHQPEFTMIEWYRAYENLQAIQKDVLLLVDYLATKIPQLKSPQGYGIFAISQLFHQYCEFKVTPQTN